MANSEFLDAALVLIGHGSTQNTDSGAPVYQHAAELRGRHMFAQVREGFWKQEPQITKVLAQLREPRIFVAPLFISEGFFGQDVIPRALGFLERDSGPTGRVARKGTQTLLYCQPVGSHENMTQVLLARAREVIQKFPFPRAPKPKEVTLFIAGHGTEQNENSRKAVEHHVGIIRAHELYAEAHGVFLEEEPRVGDCYRLAQTKNIVIVPFFISEGMHVREDIPVMLGESPQIVQQRLEKGHATWRNPSEKKGKLVWLASSIGTERSVADIVLERVREAAKLAKGLTR